MSNRLDKERQVELQPKRMEYAKKQLEEAGVKIDFELKPFSYLTKKQYPFWNWEIFKKEGMIYIDDMATGIALKNSVYSTHKMVDWDGVKQQLIENGLVEQ